MTIRHYEERGGLLTLTFIRIQLTGQSNDKKLRKNSRHSNFQIFPYTISNFLAIVDIHGDSVALCHSSTWGFTVHCVWLAVPRPISLHQDECGVNNIALFLCIEWINLTWCPLAGSQRSLVMQRNTGMVSTVPAGRLPETHCQLWFIQIIMWLYIIHGKKVHICAVM